MTEPLLSRLAARGERLTVGALPWVAPVYSAMPQVAEVIALPFARGALQLQARRAIARQIKDRFDKAYVLPNSLKSALLPALAGIPQRIGYLGEMRLGLLTQWLPNPKNKPPMVAFYSALSGEGSLETDRPQLQMAAPEIKKILVSLGLQQGRYAVFAPGAEYGPAKRWPTAHFSELATRLDMTVVLLGSVKEASLCDAIAAPVNAAQPGKCINLAGKTSLPQAFCLIAASRSTISNDSGLMHVAAAFGVPQVAIFGSSSPLHTPPLNDKASVLWLKTDPAYQPPLDCSPCFQRVCPLPADAGHMRCLQDIGAAAVLNALSVQGDFLTP